MSILLGLFIACQQTTEVTPGEIPETGNLIATVNGNKSLKGLSMQSLLRFQSHSVRRSNKGLSTANSKSS